MNWIALLGGPQMSEALFKKPRGNMDGLAPSQRTNTLRVSLVSIWSKGTLIAAFLLALFPHAVGAQSKPSEYSVKAAYLLNFGKFLRQPASVEAQRRTFNICILGEDPFGQAIDSLATNEMVSDHPVHVLRLKRPEDGASCAIAYISASEGKRSERDLQVLANLETLTVSDSPDFLKWGGMIQFLLISNHVRFAVNLQAVHRTQLALSSDLLRVASSVVTEGSGEARQ